MTDASRLQIINEALLEANATADYSGLKEANVVAAVREMTDRFDCGVDDATLCYVLGWWYELSAAGESDEATQDEFHTRALNLLLPIYIDSPEEVPNKVAEDYENIARGATDAAVEELRKLVDKVGGGDPDTAVEHALIAVNLTPLTYPDRANFLSNFCVALRVRHEYLGSSEDIDASVDAGRAAVACNHPRQADHLVNLATTLRIRYESAGNISDLDEAIAADRLAIRHTNRGDFQADLAHLLRKRYEALGSLDDLSVAVGAMQSGLALSESDEERVKRGADLAALLYDKAEYEQDLDGFQEAIDVAKRAIDRARRDDPGLKYLWSTVADASSAVFECTGEPGAIDAEVTARRAAVRNSVLGSQDHAGCLTNLGNALRRRSESNTALQDINEAVEFCQAAVDATREPSSIKAGFLTNLASALACRFDRFGLGDDIERAVDAARAAVSLKQYTGPNPKHLLNLSNTLRQRSSLTRNSVEAAEALGVARAALALLPEASPDRGTYYSILSHALLEVFDYTQDDLDLEEAISRASQAVDLASDSRSNQSELAARLTGLGIALRLRFTRTRELVDLDNAIQMHKKAIAVSRDDPTRFLCLGNLANCLGPRYGLIGHLSDLEEAVSSLQAVLRGSPADDSKRCGHLSSLGTGLRLRFARSGDTNDLNLSVAAIQEAVESASSGDPDYAKYLSNLADSLCDRFELLEAATDLEWALIYSQRAVEASVSLPNQIRAEYISIQATILYARFVNSGDLADLRGGIQLFETALSLSSENDPEWARYSLSIAQLFELRYRKLAVADDRERALSAYRAAATGYAVSPDLMCEAEAAVGRLSSGVVATSAFRRALDILPRVAGNALVFADAAARFSKLANVGRDAAAAYISAGEVDAALVAVEYGRAMVFARTMNRRVELGNLYNVHPALAERLEAALATLDRLSTGPSALLFAPASDRAGSKEASDLLSRRNLAEEEFESALTDVHALGGAWASLFLPTEIEDLLPASSDGPIVVINVASRRCDALIVSPNGVHCVPLPELSERMAVDMVNTFVSATADLTDAATAPDRLIEAEAQLRAVMSWLWDSVTEPVLNFIGITKARVDRDYQDWPRVWWIPTGILTVLPMHAAGYHGAPIWSSYSDNGTTVIDRVVSSTLPTIGALAQARVYRCPETGVQRALGIAMPHTPDHEGFIMPDLPETMMELDLIEDAIGKSRVKLLAPAQRNLEVPTKAKVLECLPKHAWAHFACHAYTDLKFPTRSALLLPDHQSDALTVLDLVGLRLPDAHLAYLSACTTARGAADYLDEPIHLAAAALLAGYRHVIATLWPLADESEPAALVYRTLASPDHIDWTARLAPVAVHAAAHHRRASTADFLDWANLLHYGP